MSQHHASLVHGRASKYLDRHFNRQAMKILPGEFYATREDEVIVTVLGSCVAACLLDPIAMVGGQNAFFIRQFLKDEGIPLWVEDMGGKHPRKVYFFPHTGQVLESCPEVSVSPQR